MKELTMKKFLIVLFCLLVVLPGIMFAQEINDSLLWIPKTTVTPVVDGQMEDIWKIVPEILTRYVALESQVGPADDWYDLFVTMRVMHDDANIYLFVSLQDEVIATTDPRVYRNDAVEFYFDGDNSKTPLDYDGVNDVQIMFGVDGATLIGTGESSSWGFSLDNTEHAEVLTQSGVDDDDAGWSLEVKIPKADLLLESEFGFDIQIDDNDGAGRETVYRWWGLDNQSWRYADRFGTAQLIDREISETLDIAAVKSTPLIDGEMSEGEWDSVTVISGNTYDGTMSFYDVWDWTDLRLKTHLARDNDNIYIFAEVRDDILDTDADKVSLFFDGNNSKSSGSYDGVDDVELGFILGKSAPEDIAISYGGASDWGVSTAGIEYITTEKDSFWTLEAKVPLSNLSISSAEFGFEVQVYDPDNDVDKMVRWWGDSTDVATDASLFGTAILRPTDPSSIHFESPAPLKSFVLTQNYPNPFNPGTKIQYTIPTQNIVKLTVYNLLGKEIATLVNEKQSAGSHTVTFNGSNLTSGIYFYRLESGSQALVKKMTLLK